MSLGKARAPMEHKRSAILGYDKDVAEVFSQALIRGGYDAPERSSELAVSKLGAYDPAVLMVDFDHLRSDKLESVRQVRFVLPNCAIAIVSSELTRVWARSCHMAGATCVLPSGQQPRYLLAGLRRGIATGCFTHEAFEGGTDGSNTT